MGKESLQALPSVEIIISSPQCEALNKRFGRDEVIAAIRKILGQARQTFLTEALFEMPSRDEISSRLIQNVSNYLESRYAPSLRKAVNAAGVILHTGLGRAVLSAPAAESVQNVIGGYCTLATDIETGKRGHRDRHLNHLICELTGAEAAVVVNNNAAATMLVLNTVASGKEVLNPTAVNPTACPFTVTWAPSSEVPAQVMDSAAMTTLSAGRSICSFVRGMATMCSPCSAAPSLLVS